MTNFLCPCALILIHFLGPLKGSGLSASSIETVTGQLATFGVGSAVDENLTSKETREDWVKFGESIAGGKPVSVEFRLHQALLKNYQKHVRPVHHPSDPVFVAVSVFLYQVIKLDQQKNTVTLSGSFELYWRDTYLQWNPLDYENATNIFLSSKDLWTPELSLYYSHHHNEGVVLKTDNDLRLNYTGHLRYYVPFSTESLCPINVQYFPFDNQTCQLYFGSWAHPNKSLSYSLHDPKEGLNTIDFYDNQEWELQLDNCSAEVAVWPYPYHGGIEYWNVIVINIAVQRQSFYYVFNLVIPSTMIVVVAVFGFHSPSTSGRVRDAKFRLGIMTLMSMSVILLAVVSDMPKFAMSVVDDKRRGSFSGVPLIGLFYFCLLLIVGMATITTSFFVFLERNVKRAHNIPWYLRWLDCNHCQDTKGYELTAGVHCTLQNSDVDTPREELRKRLSVAHYDNLLVYQYFHQLLEDLSSSISSIEQSLSGIRHEMVSLLPQDDLVNRWSLIIRRLEIISLIYYLSCLAICCYMFVHHSWWY